MPNFTIIIIGIICVIIYSIKPFRRWLSKDENYNAGVFLIAFFGLVVALPVFSNQINNIQIKIDSVQTSLKEMFSRQRTEVFSAIEADKFEVIDYQGKGDYLKIPLKETPLQGSVTLWFTGLVQSPDWYITNDNIVLLKMSYTKNDLKELFSGVSDYNPIIVTYTTL